MRNSWTTRSSHVEVWWWLRAAATVFGILLATFVRAQGFEHEVATLSAAMAAQISQSGRKTVAVVDFTDLEGNVTELGRFLAEEFSAALAGSGKGFEVIDRNNLKTIMQEQKLATTGIIDPATAKRLGQIVGVDALITGTLTPFGDTVRLSIKILDTSTARIVGATRGDIPKTKAIEELLGRGLSNPVSPGGQSVQRAAPAPAAGPAVSARSVPEATRVVEAEDYRFEVRNCKRLPNGHVQCAVTITNIAQAERKLLLWGYGFSIIDDQGDAHRPDGIVFGTDRNEGQFSLDYSPSQPMPPGVPVRLHLELRKLPEAIHAVNIRLQGTSNWREFSVTLTGVPCGE